MALRNSDGGSAVTTVIEALTSDISSRRVRPGERIVEAELARRFETSRGPVREALQHLSARGLLEEHPRRGWAVRKLSRREVRELYDVREVLEGQAAALAAQRIDDVAVREQVEQLKAWLENFEGDLARYVEELKERDRFHDELCALSQNQLLMSMLTQLRPLILQLQFSGFIYATRPGESIAEHVEILDAILAGDQQSADRLTRTHIRVSRDLLLALPEEIFA